jgi:lipid-A-disaccharide synthase
MKIFLSTGEPSGDLHAANLIRSIRQRDPDARFTGFGGPLMKEAGATVVYPLVDLAVMWFLDVFINIVTFIRLVFRADRIFRDEKPDAVVLIDYPGLHWWLARRAKARGVPVFYFVPPQIWAWAGWRVTKIRRDFDEVLCSLPFEPAWYEKRGYDKAHFVGHPYFDELNERPLDASFLAAEASRSEHLVAILPGSRKKEVIRNLPEMIRAAGELARRRPDVRFAVACFNDAHKALANSIIAEVKASEGSIAWPNIDLFAGRTPELIRVARVAWAVSGSVGLELMMEALPTVVIYKIKQFDLWVARQFIKTKYISLVNLLGDAEVFPEYLTYEDVSAKLVDWAVQWLDDGETRSRATGRLEELRARVAHPGACDRAADRILRWLADRAPSSGTVPHGSPAYARALAKRAAVGETATTES